MDEDRDDAEDDEEEDDDGSDDGDDDGGDDGAELRDGNINRDILTYKHNRRRANRVIRRGTRKKRHAR